MKASRQLAAVLLPVLGVAMLVMTVLDLALGGEGSVIVNGVTVLDADDGWWRLVLAPAFWLVGLSASALVAAGVERGRNVRPLRALVAAVRNFPVFASGLVAIAGITGLALWLVASIGSGWFGVALVVAVLLTAGVVAARMLVGLLAHQLGGFDWAITRGRVAGTAGAFLLGGVVMPLVAQALLPGELVSPAPGLPALDWFVRVAGALAVAVVVGLQAGILAHVYLEQPDADRGAPGGTPPSGAQPGGGQQVDLGLVDARLDEMAGPATRLLPWAGALLVVATLVVPAVANPLDLPVVRSHGDSTSSAAAVAWPAGKHPTIATMTGARFCDDDLCDRYESVNGGPAVYDGQGAAGISADGETVVKAQVSGGSDNGGPYINYARCTRAGCPEAWVPLRRSAKEKVDWPEIGAAVGPDEALWFVLAFPAEKTYRIVFVRCGEVGCARPQRYEAGTVERFSWDEEFTTVARVRLTVGADGRPLATVRSGNAALSVTCDPLTCANVRKGSSFLGHPVSAWEPPTTVGGPAVSMEPGLLRAGDLLLTLPGDAVAGGSGAVAGTYATAAEQAARPGFHVTVGEPAPETGYWRQVLWRCDASRCARTPLDRLTITASGHEAMAVGADGRVLIVRQDAILLVTP
ncbi:hypothetical protein ACTI_63340 [Actinoplanes sp. OR16]|nr:hypothetical protein ACTI_63340 [Actinoplanes sp. OR16]